MGRVFWVISLSAASHA